MPHSHEEVAREAVAVIGRGDLDAMQDYFAEHIRYHVPGTGPFAGDYEGVAQVLGLVGRVFEASGGTLRLEMHDVVSNDEHVVLLFTVHVERGGMTYQDKTVQVVHGHDGKAHEVWTYPADLYSHDEFWSYAVMQQDQ